jgi:hypothetical protein
MLAGTSAASKDSFRYSAVARRPSSLPRSAMVTSSVRERGGGDARQVVQARADGGFFDARRRCLGGLLSAPGFALESLFDRLGGGARRVVSAASLLGAAAAREKYPESEHEGQTHHEQGARPAFYECLPAHLRLLTRFCIKITARTATDSVHLIFFAS